MAFPMSECEQQNLKLLASLNFLPHTEGFVDEVSDDRKY